MGAGLASNRALPWRPCIARECDRVPVPADGERLEAKMTTGAHGEQFLRAPDKLTVRGPKRFGQLPPTTTRSKSLLERDLVAGLTKRQLAAAMILLLNEGRIKVNEPVVKGTD
jgi:hypothetical protein